MQLIESLLSNSSQKVRRTHGENKKNNGEFASDEVSENFLSMLQKNMKLTQQTTIHETFQFLSYQSNTTSNVNSSLNTNQEIYKPKKFSVDQDNYSRTTRPTEYAITDSSHNNVKEERFEVEQESKPAEKAQDIPQVAKKDIPQVIKKDIPQVIKKDMPQVIKKDIPQVIKKEQVEEVSLKNDEPVEKSESLKVDQTKSTQIFDDLLPKMKKTSDAEAKKIGQELGEVKNLLGKSGDKNNRLSKINLRSSLADKNTVHSSLVERSVAKEESHVKQFDTQTHNQFKLHEQSFRLGYLEKQIDQVSEIKNQFGKNSLSAYDNYSFSETASTQNQVRNSRLSQLLQSPGLKDRLNDGFQSMLHRARILIKDQKNASLSTSLHPKELGTVALKLSMMDGNLNGLFTVENEAVQKLITEKMDKILSSLREDGYQVTSFNVNVRSGHSSSHESNLHNQNSSKKGWFPTGPEGVEEFPWQDDLGQRTGEELYA